MMEFFVHSGKRLVSSCIVRNMDDWSDLDSNWFDLVKDFEFSTVIVDKIISDYDEGGAVEYEIGRWGNKGGRLLTDDEKRRIRRSVCAKVWFGLYNRRDSCTTFSVILYK